MLILQIVCFICLVLSLFVSGYFAVLTVMSLLPRRRATPRPLGSRLQRSFAIVIPAHNEEGSIARTLRSCFALDYPRDLYEVFVVADNCTDGTVAIAAEFAVTCLQRRDAGRQGKGHALEWAFERILRQGHDAVIVLDADCTIQPDALTIFDRYLEKGEQILQAKVVASNPDDSPTSLALAVANLLENDQFYAPKDRLGWAVFLRGTGMVFARDVLLAHPFRARSRVEDKEYTLRLIRAGLTIRFLSEVHIWSAFPIDHDQLYAQRERWTAGTFHFSKRLSLRLIAHGLIRRRPRMADAGWTLLADSRPLLFLQLLMTILLAIACCWVAPGNGSHYLLGGAALATLLDCAYWGIGVIRLGISPRRLALLCSIPVLVIRLVVIFLKGVVKPHSGEWLSRNGCKATATRLVAKVPVRFTPNLSASIETRAERE
jgi:1,2-diacylglycerol 3-beta-glucosyltransferase